MDSLQEKKLYERFKKSFDEFPKIIRESVDQQDKPDVIIFTSKEAKISIELTELFQDSDQDRKTGSELKELENVQQKIGEQIVKKIKDKSNIHFCLDIDFNFKTLKGERRKTLIEDTCKFLEKQLNHLEQNQTLSFSNFGGLPKEVKGLGITTVGNLSESYFGISMGGVERNLSKDHINSVLKEKHKDLQEYEICDEYWLLIKIGNFYAGSFDSIFIESEFKSMFSKIIIHDIRDSSNNKLKVKPYS